MRAAVKGCEEGPWSGKCVGRGGRLVCHTATRPIVRERRVVRRSFALRRPAIALVFVLRRKWDMIGWMVFYILAIPIMSLAIPLYSFWRMDDFSWGQTRIVLGEAGKKLIVHDEGKFDPRSIPLKSWNEYVRPSYFIILT